MKKILLGGLALAAVACSDGGTPPSSNGVAAVTVTAPATTLVVGGTLQLTASVLTRDGNPVSGATVSWQSANPTIASVSGSGLVTGVAEGSATIRASAGGKTGEIAVTVDVNRCTTPLSMSPGEVRVLSGAEAVSCITLAPASDESEFVFVTANASTTPDQTGSYTVSAAIDGAPSVAPSASPNLAGTDLSVLVAEDALEVHDRFESRLRTSERRLFEGRSRSRLHRASRERAQADASLMDSGAETAGRAAAAQVAAIGDTLSLRVTDAGSGDLCTNYANVKAVVKAVGRRAQIAIDVKSPAEFTSADYAEIAREFDDLIYPVDTDWFGTPTDVNNDQKITILYTPEVNKLTPPNSTGMVGGFFFSGDLFERSIPAENWSCPASNFMEVFYLLAPDPEGTINDNPRSTETVRQGTRGTIAHEFQHMINLGVRIQGNAESGETSWLNEGMSHMAEEIVGRAIRGYGDSRSLTWDDVTTSVDDYNAFFRQNLLRFRTWMQRPDTSSPTSARAASQLAPRGAAWALVRYAADQYAGANQKAFFRNVAKGPKSSIANLEQWAGRPFDDIIAGFLVAMYADGADIPGLDPRYTLKTWDLREVMPRVNNGNYPLLVSPLTQQVTTKSLSGSGNYFRVVRPAGSSSATFRMLGAGGGNVSFGGARVYVLRVR